jgi:hypothetical protein
MTKMRLLSVLFLLVLTFFLSCTKEPVLDEAANDSGDSTAIANKGWSFLNNGIQYHGCVDSAFILSNGPAPVLMISGTDSAGNTYLISASGSAGSLTTGDYSSTQNTASIVLQTADDIYSSGTGSTFSINITTLNDTLLIATFTAELSTTKGSQKFIIENGKIIALIGKENPCGVVSDNGGNPGTGTGQAKFSLVGNPGTCSNYKVEGTYVEYKFLDPANYVELEVNVSEKGEWNIATSSSNGFLFFGSGEFTTTGSHTIRLYGDGTPTVAGTTTIPLTAGTSNCSFKVEVNSIPAAPCEPANNTANLKTLTNMQFNSVFGRITTYTYEIIANSDVGDLRFIFHFPYQPAPGVYDVVQVGSGTGMWNVEVDAVALNTWWTPTQGGKAYVSVKDGKVTVIFCDLSLTGTLQDSYTLKASAKITEQ